MTRKHFEVIAESIKKDYIASNYSVTVASVAIGLANVFRDQNPRFDRTKFLRACGLNIE